MNSQNKDNHFQGHNGVGPNPINMDPNCDSAWDKNRMMRITMESWEVGILLCNLFFDRFGLAKLFAIVNQILPTAYILNTGYWVFYSSRNGGCICICNRFGLRCPHRRVGFHWIDIAALKNAEENYLFSLRNEKMFPSNYNVVIDPIVNDVLRAYDINVKLIVQPCDLHGNQYTIKSDQKTTLHVDARYILTPEYFPLQSSIVQFNPHPMSHPHYSRYFECLQRLNIFYSSSPLQLEVPRTFTIICSDIPTFTVITNNNATSNYHPSPNINLPSWSGPFQTFYGHFDDMEPTPSHVNQHYYNFNITNNAIVASIPPPQPPPPPYNQVVSSQQLFSYPQRHPYNPTLAYQNRPNKRQYVEQPRLISVPMLPEKNIATKQTKRGKAAVSAKSKIEQFKLPSVFQLPPASQNNLAYQEPRQPSSLLTTTNSKFSSSVRIVSSNDNNNTRKFNPTVRKPVYPDLKKTPEVNFRGADYRESFPALPAPNSYKKKPQPKPIPPPSIPQVTETTSDTENNAYGFDPLLAANVQNLKSQLEVQRMVSIRYDTEVAQMFEQSSETNCILDTDIDPSELLSLVSDVIQNEINKDPPMINPQEFDDFQQAHTNFQLSDNSFDEPFSPDEDSLYIDELKFLNDDAEK